MDHHGETSEPTKSGYNSEPAHNTQKPQKRNINGDNCIHKKPPTTVQGDQTNEYKLPPLISKEKEINTGGTTLETTEILMRQRKTYHGWPPSQNQITFRKPKRTSNSLSEATELQINK